MALTARQKVDDELTQYLRRTTLRVLPRAGRAGSYVARWIWIFIFLLLLLVVLILIGQLIDTYKNQKYFLRVETSKKDPAFPAVTICPLAPFKRRSLSVMQTYKVNPTDLDILLDELGRVSGTNFTGARDASYAVHYEAFGPVVRNLYKQYAYYKYDDLFIECLVDLGNENFFISSSYWDICRDIKTQKFFFFDVERVTFAKFPYCFTFTPKEKYRDHIVGLRLFINLATTLPQSAKEMGNQRCLECFFLNPESWRSGVRLIVHEANTMPDDSAGRDVEAGTVNEVHFTTTRKNLIKLDCTKVNAASQIWDRNRTYKYTEQACRMVKLQDTLVDRCGCLDSRYPIGEALTARGLPYCWNMMDAAGNKVNFTADIKARNEIIRRLECKRNLHESDNDPLSCEPPCMYYEYSINVASSAGIKECMLPRLCRSVASITDSHAYFNETVFKDMMKVCQNGSFEKVYRSMRENAVRENFVAITVRRTSFTLQVNNAMWIISDVELVSRIGGLCALFIGFTVFAIIEIFELCLFVALRFLPKEYLLSMQRWFGVLPSRMQREYSSAASVSTNLKLKSMNKSLKEDVGTQTAEPYSLFDPLAKRAWSIRM